MCMYYGWYSLKCDDASFFDLLSSSSSARLIRGDREEKLIAAMSDVFEGYERRFRELSAELVRKKSSIGDLDGELKIQMITEIKAEMDEAEGMILKMDADARSLPPNVKAVLLAKLREYQSDLNDMKNKANLIASTNFHRDELMEAGMADSITVPENNGDRIQTATAGGLNSSDDPVEEELEVPLLQDLHQHHETTNEENTVHELDANNNRVAVSHGNCTIVGILVALAVIILIVCFILFFKFSK